ncbi:MAG: hypothetical protein ACXWNL_02390 [Vulcanimicrobiaceae bacterium]
MFVIAHIAGMPVEELLVPLAGGTGAGVLLLVVRIWVMSRVRH